MKTTDIVQYLMDIIKAYGDIDVVGFDGDSMATLSQLEKTLVLREIRKKGFEPYYEVHLK